MNSHQKNKLIAILIGIVLALLLIATTKSFAQYNHGRYHVDGYWENSIPVDSLIIPVNFYLTITKEQVEIYSLDTDSLIFHNTNKTRALTFEYKEGTEVKRYYKWLIDMGSLIFYESDGTKYLTKYTQNLMKLPEEYITYRVSGDLYDHLIQTSSREDLIHMDSCQTLEDSLNLENQKLQKEVDQMKDLLEFSRIRLEQLEIEKRHYMDSARQKNQEELKKTFDN